MKKNIALLSAALLISVLICSCAAETENGGGKNSVSAPEIDTETTAETTPQTAVDSDDKKAVKSGTELRIEFFHSLEYAGLESEEYKEIANGSELKLVDFTDCSAAALDSQFFVKIYEYLSDEALAEFIDCITNSDISQEEYEGEVPLVDGGARNGFKVKLNTGEIIVIYSNHIDTLIHINGKVFTCNEECNRKLDKMYGKASKRFDETWEEYREKAWQQ